MASKTILTTRINRKHREEMNGAILFVGKPLRCFLFTLES